MSDAEKYRSLLQQKKGLVFELLRLSSDLGLNGGTPEQSADRYLAFVAERETLLEKLRALEGALKAFAGRKDLAAGETELLREIQAMGDQVIRLEPEITRKAHSLSAHFQRRVNAIRTQKQEAQSRGEYTKGLRYQKSI